MSENLNLFVTSTPSVFGPNGVVVKNERGTFVMYQGNLQSVAQLSKLVRIAETTLRARISKGFTGAALLKPTKASQSAKPLPETKRLPRSIIVKVANALGIRPDTFAYRVESGMSAFQALQAVDYRKGK